MLERLVALLVFLLLILGAFSLGRGQEPPLLLDDACDGCLSSFPLLARDHEADEERDREKDEDDREKKEERPEKRDGKGGEGKGKKEKR